MDDAITPEQVFVTDGFPSLTYVALMRDAENLMLKKDWHSKTRSFQLSDHQSPENRLFATSLQQNVWTDARGR